LAVDGVSAWTLIVSDRQTKFAGDEAYAAAEHYLYAKESVAQGERAIKMTTLSAGYQLMKLIYTGEGQTPASSDQLTWGFSGVLRGLDLRDISIPSSNNPAPLVSP